MDNLVEKCLAYNRELKEGLELMYNGLPPGQQKQVLKNPRLKSLLIKFGVIQEV